MGQQSKVVPIKDRTPDEQAALDKADFIRDARALRKGINELRDHAFLFTAGELMTIHDHLTDSIKSLESAVCIAGKVKC